MFSILPLVLCCSGDVARSAALRADPFELHGIAMTAEATRTTAHGLQIVSVRIRPQSNNPNPTEFDSLRIQLNLVATTRDPNTKIDVIYPKGHKNGVESIYRDDEVAIQIILQRAAGDQSPVQGRLDFGIRSLIT